MFMNDGTSTWMQAEVVESQVHFTLTQLSRACGVEDVEITVLVDEGVVNPSDSNRMFFDAGALSRARIALRLLNDLELNAHAAALVMDLLDEIDEMRGELTHLRARAEVKC